jgi:hypothetical protein
LCFNANLHIRSPLNSLAYIVPHCAKNGRLNQSYADQWVGAVAPRTFATCLPIPGPSSRSVQMPGLMGRPDLGQPGGSEIRRL